MMPTLADEALRLSKEIVDPKLLAQILCYSGSVLQWRGDFGRSLAYHHEAAEQAQHAHAGFLFGMDANTAKGEYEEALRWYRRLGDYAISAGDRFWMARAPNIIGGVHLELFDLDETIRLCLEGDEVAQRVYPWPEPRGHSLLKVGLAHLQRGEHGGAEEFFRRTWALLEEDLFMRWR
jgi:tetratricopeptide (TPR) repeat protein